MIIDATGYRIFSLSSYWLQDWEAAEEAEELKKALEVLKACLSQGRFSRFIDVFFSLTDLWFKGYPYLPASLMLIRIFVHIQ